MANLLDRFRNSWNVFMGRDAPTWPGRGAAGGHNPNRVVLRRNNIRTIIGSVYNQMAIDAAQIDIKHVRLDDEHKFKEVIYDELNDVLNRDSNIDQTGRNMLKDAILSMFDEGCVALVPVVMDIDPTDTEKFKVENVRVGKIVEWYPQHIRVELYNELTGMREQTIVEKRYTPIIENPFYITMNEPNSLAQRLIRVLNQLDQTNEQSSSGKIDLLVQLPYALKGQRRIDEANERLSTLEAQLSGSQYGIGYIDATEKVIQLNRSVENNLWTQALDLQTQLFNQLGFSQKIFDGTADEATMLNYYNRSIEPIMTAIVEEIDRKWISKTARTQGQTIKFFKDPFKLVPVAQLAEIADKFTRNEIMSSNEFRGTMGMAPSKDPKADELRNSNLNHPDEAVNNQKQVTDSGIDDVIKNLDS